MRKFEFFNQFTDAVIVTDSFGKTFFQNNTFKRWFKNFSTLEKFSHNMNFDICPINSDNIEIYSPIYHALSSKENFFAHVSYEISENKIMYYNLTAIKKRKYTAIFLTDVTANNKINDLTTKINEVVEKYNELQNENNELQKIKQQAQAQAIRIALINKMSNIIRESMDISKILSSALSELAIMFGAYKAYYAKKYDTEFIIEEIYGEKELKHQQFQFDKNTQEQILSGKISVNNSLIEYIGAEPLKQSVLRIIVPVFHMQEIIGVIVLLSYQKRELTEELEILEAISSQLGNAIISAELQLQLINSEKMASLGQLVAGVAHEINTPLAAIKSNNTVLKQLAKQIKDNNILELFKQINNIDFEAIQRINNIVSSLKKFIRLDEAELQKADINKELDLTLELIRHETKNRIEIIKNYGEIPIIKCYPNMLNQVFTNILINACQAIEDKGMIEISTEFKNKKLIIKIKDNGKGIAENDLNKIFTAGFTTKSVGVGTGLGLPICKKIIEKHNGEIFVNSELGKGSEFTITISCE